MKPAKRDKKPQVPPARDATIRKQMISLLEEKTLSAKALSSLVGVSEKDICSHLEHIRKSLAKGTGHFVLLPPACRACGFVFGKRDRLSAPSRCPVCHSESVEEPLFSIRGRSS